MSNHWNAGKVAITAIFIIGTFHGAYCQPTDVNSNSISVVEGNNSTTISSDNADELQEKKGGKGGGSSRSSGGGGTGEALKTGVNGAVLRNIGVALGAGYVLKEMVL